jgi:tetratricopeptide (TPR) repeat protein
VLSTDPDRALHVIAMLEKYWFTRGSFDEWEFWISAALQRSSGSSDSDRAWALAQSAFILLHRNELELARSAAEEALAIASDHGLTEIMGQAVADLGLIARARGDLTGAMHLSRRALDLYTESGVEIAYAAQLGNIAILEMDLGEYERAISTFKSSSDVLLAHGETFFAATSLLNLGEVYRMLGKLDQANEKLIDAISLFRVLGSPQLAGEALVVRANVMLDRGDDDIAIQLLVEAFADDINSLSREGTLVSIESVAVIAVIRDDASLAARLFGATDALRAIMSISLAQPDQQRLVRHLTDCRSILGEADWQRAWSAGQLLSLIQATTVAYDALVRWYSGGSG